jgi:hypothetical protein
LGVSGNALAETLDLARFTPPAGWQPGRTATALTFTHLDQGAGTYGIIGVYQSTPSRGAEQDFAAEWQAIVRNGFTTGPTPRPSVERTSAGLSYLAGEADARRGEVRSWVKLLVFPAGARVVSVLLNASDAAALSAREVAIQAFLDSLRIEGASSAPPAANAQALPDTTPNAAFSGPTCPTPAGWRRIEADGALKLERVDDLGFGQKNLFRVTFLPPVRAQRSASATFDTLFRQVAAANFQAPIHPLPLRVRLKRGASLLYDGGDMRLREGGIQVTGMVYVVLQGGMAGAAVGVFTGWDSSVDRALREIFDGVRIVGAARKEPPLFTRRALAGRWRSSTSALGNWVDAAGNYRGDASLAAGETLTLRSGGKTTRYRITGVGRSADGKAAFLLLGITRDDFPLLSAGSTSPRAGDLYVRAAD